MWMMLRSHHTERMCCVDVSPIKQFEAALQLSEGSRALAWTLTLRWLSLTARAHAAASLTPSPGVKVTCMG